MVSSVATPATVASGQVTEQTRLVAEQQRQIHELQLKLLESERKLQVCLCWSDVENCLFLFTGFHCDK